jgi:urea transporter
LRRDATRLKLLFDGWEVEVAKTWGKSKNEEEQTMAFLLRYSSSAVTKRCNLYQPGWSSRLQLLLLSNHQQQRRCFATTGDRNEDEQTKQKASSTTTTTTTTTTTSLLETAGTGTGTGQVIFLNSPDAGAVILVSLALGDPMVALMAGTGSLVSTVTAHTTMSSSSANEATKNGLLSYNSCLVGCATAGLLCPGAGLLTILPLTMVGAVVTTYITAVPMTSPMPQWTIAFNLLTYTTLLALYKPITTTAAATVVVATTSAFDLLVSPLTGLGQIFVVESALTGFGICLAVARYSPQLAVHMVLGSAVGGLTGSLLLSADPAAVAAGLWSYNSALTSAGTAVFLRSTSNNHRPMTVWLVSGVGASLTALTYGAVSAVSPVPCLTIPFCVVMSGIWWLAHGKLVDGVALAPTPHSPERNHDDNE